MNVMQVVQVVQAGAGGSGARLIPTLLRFFYEGWTWFVFLYYFFADNLFMNRSGVVGWW